MCGFVNDTLINKRNISPEYCSWSGSSFGQDDIKPILVGYYFTLENRRLLTLCQLPGTWPRHLPFGYPENDI